MVLKRNKRLFVHKMQFLNIGQDKGIISKKIGHHFKKIFIDELASRVQKWCSKPNQFPHIFFFKSTLIFKNNQ